MSLTSAREPGIAAVAAAVLVLGAGGSPPRDTIAGFAPDSLILQRQIEGRFLRLPSASRLRQFHRYLTAEPHVAGSPRNRHLAEWQRQQWIAWGIEDVHIVTHDVLLPYPQEVRVEMTAPKPWQASLREDAVAGDPDTKQDPGPTYHAFSASGDVTGEVVYAGSGNPEHYDWLTAQGIDLKGKIALVRYSVPYSYRGFKALTAQQRGLAGILIYSDPADDGFGKGKTYPAGPWGPESHIQRGGIPFDFLVPGDPLTPGWASVPGARRIAAEEAVSIPKIISVPLSYRDARVILEALGGPEVPATWRGGLPIPYRAGGGAAAVRMVVRIDSAVRQIQTVVGRIRGSQQPEQEVILGNHRDAWVFGGVDPSSGSASLMELARSLGTLAARRLPSEADDRARELGRRRIHADLLDGVGRAVRGGAAAPGGRVHQRGQCGIGAGVHCLRGAVAQPAGSGGRRATCATRDRASRSRRRRRVPATAERGALPNAQGQGLVNNRLGSGSDYTVFLNFLGIPIIDISFDGPYGVYHSIYDNHQWVSRVGDPGFRYHTAMTKLWGLMALRLANADVLPFDYPAYAAGAERVRDRGREALDRRTAASDRHANTRDVAVRRGARGHRTLRHGGRTDRAGAGAGVRRGGRNPRATC